MDEFEKIIITLSIFIVFNFVIRNILSDNINSDSLSYTINNK